MNQILTTIPRMRTIHEAAVELKQLDSHTAMTEHHIRQLVLTGVLPRLKCGKKLLINLDTLLDYMSNPEKENDLSNNVSESFGNCIRRIN